MKIKWNPRVKLILSDVDETVADLYLSATDDMLRELQSLLSASISIFLISGQGIKGIQWRITDKIPDNLRRRILIAHCSGSEVWGFDYNGSLSSKPFYSVYDRTLDKNNKDLWRSLVKQVLDEFKIKTYETMPVVRFREISKNNPLSIMYEDRGPQITLEVVNGADLELSQVDKLEIKVPETHGAYDIRIPIVERADELFIKNNIPVTSRLGGEFAIDFAIKGVSKETAVKYALENEEVLEHIGLKKSDLSYPTNLEIWGDKFSEIRGGTDRHMCEAVDPKVRAIDFRQENPEEFPKGYSIVVWDGKKHLHEGLLEYLQKRNLNE